MTNKFKYQAVVAAFAVVGLSSFAQAGVIQCSEPAVTATKNYMEISDVSVSSCLASGIGNINGSPSNDAFLLIDNSWTFVSKIDGANNIGDYGLTYTQSGDTGSFSFSNTFWDDFAEGAIGFKFGTGDQPDEWFVYELNEITSGDWSFVNVLGKGGGLSHVNLYGKETTTEVPEPHSLALLVLGLAGLSVRKKLKKSKSS